MARAMTASKTASARIPVANLEAIIAAALEGLDLTHDAEWHRPPGCPCHRLGRNCLLPLPAEEGSCQGHAVEVPTPPEHMINLDILTAALPQPDNDGTVGVTEAGNSILSVIEQRLSYPYTLRAIRLRNRLTEEAELYEQQAGLTDTGVQEDAASVRRCQHCGNLIPPARGKKARFCSDSHRVSSHRAARRAAERAANEVPARQPLTVIRRSPARHLADSLKHAGGGGRAASRITSIQRPTSLPADHPHNPGTARAGTRVT